MHSGACGIGSKIYVPVAIGPGEKEQMCLLKTLEDEVLSVRKECIQTAQVESWRGDKIVITGICLEILSGSLGVFVTLELVVKWYRESVTCFLALLVLS